VSVSASMMVASVLGTIPSPSRNSIDIGPLSLNAYGLCIGLAALAQIYIAQRRWAARGGDPEDVFEIAKWGLPAGLIGARLYHIFTPGDRVDGRTIVPLADWVKVWEGGLGIPGGIVLGVLVSWWAAKRRGVDVPNMIDAAIPGLPVAQAIGRIGNWFNQEIFGGPSDLPWAVEIESRFRPAEFADEPSFHPAFLYEGLWNICLAIFLVWIDRVGKLKRGMILPLYVGGYGLGRFLIEAIRSDGALKPFGIRVNLWTSGFAMLFSALALAFLYKKAKPSFFAADPDDTDLRDSDVDEFNDEDADVDGNDESDDDPDDDLDDLDDADEAESDVDEEGEAEDADETDSDDEDDDVDVEVDDIDDD